MSKKISWMETFAVDYQKSLTKTASLNKISAQVIVDHESYPQAQVGETITYKNEAYKVVQTDFQDQLGAGIVIEKLAENEEEMELPIEATAGLEDIKKEEEETPAEENKEEELKEEELPEESAAPAEEAPVAPEAPVADAAPAAVPAGSKAPASTPMQGGTKKLTDAPERAVTDPGNVYHIEVPDTFEQAAVATEQAIAQENSVDRTNVSGHYTWNQNRVLDRMVSDLTGVTPPAADAAPVEEKPAEEAPAPVEAPVEEAPKQEENVEEVPADDKKEKMAANRILKKIVEGK